MTSFKTPPLFLLLGVVATAAQADTDPGFYIGVSGNASLSGTSTSEDDFGETFESDFDASTGEIFIGFRSDRNNRFQVAKSDMTVEFEADEGTFEEDISGVSLDWHYVYGKELVQPYWGLGFGFYSLEGTGDAFVDGDDLSGVSFQMMVGTKLDLHEHFEVDLSFVRKSLQWERIETLSGSGVDINYTFNALNAGAAIKF